MKYFAYGSNLWLEQMGERCPDSRISCSGVLKGYRWIITSRGYANVVKSEPDEVHGIIYDISEADEKRLDKYEGVHKGSYYKARVLVDAEGKKVECLTYLDPVEAEGEPEKEYIVRINKGLMDSGLPEEYIDRYIRKFIPGSV